MFLGEDFYDLIETSRFNLIQGVSGVVINGVKPNFVLETDRFITDYDPKYGLRLSSATHIKTNNPFNQNSSFTFFMSFLHDANKTCEISFSNTLNTHVKYYPRYRITFNKLIIDYQSGTHETQFTSDFQNKQLFVWIRFDGTQNLYKMALSNYSSHVSETFNPPVNFQSLRLTMKLMLTKLDSLINSSILMTWNFIESCWKRNGMVVIWNNFYINNT